MRNRSLFIFLTLGASLIASRASANAPANRYTISSGTVKDNKTGLTWQQQFKASVSASDALAYCSSQSGGWRLPTIKELVTLFDYSAISSPGTVFLDPTAFGTVSSDDSIFWSSTSQASDSSKRWFVNFVAWIINVDVADSAGLSSARCVR